MEGSTTKINSEVDFTATESDRSIYIYVFTGITLLLVFVTLLRSFVFFSVSFFCINDLFENNNAVIIYLFSLLCVVRKIYIMQCLLV